MLTSLNSKIITKNGSRREKNDVGNMKFEQQMWQEDIVEGNVLPTRVINTIHVIGYEIHTVDHRPRIVINSYNK